MCHGGILLGLEGDVKTLQYNLSFGVWVVGGGGCGDFELPYYNRFYSVNLMTLAPSCICSCVMYTAAHDTT